MQLDLNDINTAITAIRLAQSRGAYELEESAQLLNTVLRLESFLKSHKETEQANAQLQNEEEN